MAERLDLTVMASDVITQKDARFVFNYSTMKAAERVPLDYAHDDGLVIGYAEDFKFEDASVTAKATLLSDADSPNERAKLVAHAMRNGVPFATSALVDVSEAVATKVGKDDKRVVNGREIAGPFVMFDQAIIRGVAICPHGADVATSARIAFTGKGETMSVNDYLLKFKLKEFDGGEGSSEGGNGAPGADEGSSEGGNGASGADEGSSEGENGASGAGAKKKRRVDPELEELVNEFGAERGLAFYLKGYSLAEAKNEDYESLKAREDKRAQEDAKKIEELQRRLSATVRGDKTGVTEGNETIKPSNPLMAMAAKFSMIKKGA